MGLSPSAPANDTKDRTVLKNVPVPFRPQGDSPIFAAFATKIGTVPVNGYLAPGPSPRKRGEGEEVFGSALTAVAANPPSSRSRNHARRLSLLGPPASPRQNLPTPARWITSSP
jgi:hypothetical protein